MNLVNRKYLLLAGIIGMYFFGIDSYDRTIEMVDFDTSRKSDIQSILEDHWRELAFENQESVSGLFSSEIEDSSLTHKILMKDDNSIGYMNYRQIQSGPNVWIISGVVIDKKYQNKGYGKQFMQEALHDIVQREGEIACLAVLKNNQKARSLYQNKLGFAFHSEINVDIILLAKKL
jgi:ribosomal protein S18 acetylase RimI-like enzyme